MDQTLRSGRRALRACGDAVDSTAGVTWIAVMTGDGEVGEFRTRLYVPSARRAAIAVVRPWGADRGLLADALRLLVDRLFGKWAAHRVDLDAFDTAADMIGAARRCGFLEERCAARGGRQRSCHGAETEELCADGREMMTARIATQEDLQGCLAVRAEWLAAFCQIVPASQRWCPAGAPVPNLEDETVVSAHLLPTATDLWIVVWPRHGRVQGYLLCGAGPGPGRMTIISHGPRVTGEADLASAGGDLIAAALSEAASRGLARASLSLHGPSCEVAPLVDLCRRLGFTIPSRELRLEMIRHRSAPLPEARPLRLCTATEVGYDAFFASDAAMRRCSLEEAQQNLELSARMWLVDPSRDWILGYDGADLIGLVETAVTKRGVGVIDHVQVKDGYHGQGYGRSLLHHALTFLSSRAEYVWLDTDRDNALATRLYEWAGFVIHHEHGSMEATT